MTPYMITLKLNLSKKGLINENIRYLMRILKKIRNLQELEINLRYKFKIFITVSTN
jgi:hypothetical protein